MSRLLYVASTARHIQDFHLPILTWLSKAGHTVTVGCRGANALTGPFAILEVPFAKSFTAPDNITALSLLTDCLKDNAYDVLSTHTALAGFVARTALRMSKARHTHCVHTAHGYLFGAPASLSGRATWLFEQACRGVTDDILTMNARDTQQAAHLVKRGGQVYPTNGMGVDGTQYYPVSEAERLHLRTALHLPKGSLLFYAAEFSQRKNHQALLRALPEVLRLKPDVRLLLAGDGALRLEVERLSERLGVRDRVVFLGYVADTAPYLQACDAAVSVSLSEGLPLGLMEALACGVPVAASDVKGHIDLLGSYPHLLFDSRQFSQAASSIAAALNQPRQQVILPDQYYLPNATNKFIEYWQNLLAADFSVSLEKIGKVNK